MTPHYHQQLMLKGLKGLRRCVEERKNKRAVVQVCIVYSIFTLYVLFGIVSIVENSIRFELDHF